MAIAKKGRNSTLTLNGASLKLREKQTTLNTPSINITNSASPRDASDNLWRELDEEPGVRSRDLNVTLILLKGEPESVLAGGYGEIVETIGDSSVTSTYDAFVSNVSTQNDAVDTNEPITFTATIESSGPVVDVLSGTGS